MNLSGGQRAVRGPQKDDPRPTSAWRGRRLGLSDVEKMEKFGYAVCSAAVPTVSTTLQGPRIDIRTASCSGATSRERDSFRLLQSCTTSSRPPSSGRGGSDVAGSLETKVDALCRAVDDLRQIVCARHERPARPPQQLCTGRCARAGAPMATRTIGRSPAACSACRSAQG